MKFASEFSPFVEEARAIYEKVTIDPTRFDAETARAYSCEPISLLQMSAPAVAGLEAESANYFLVKYEIEAHYVSHIELFLPSGVTEFWFTSACGAVCSQVRCESRATRVRDLGGQRVRFDGAREVRRRPQEPAIASPCIASWMILPSTRVDGGTDQTSTQVR